MSANIVEIDASKRKEELMKNEGTIKELSVVTGDTYIQSHTDAFTKKIETSEAQYTTHLNALEKAPSDPVALSNVQRSLSALQMMINAQTNAIKKFTDNAMAIINNFR